MARRRGWTIDTLLEHILALLAAKDLRDQQRHDAATTGIAAALTAAEKAVTKAETANERRFEGVNEFRQTLSDQAATFISRVEYETANKAYEDRLRSLAARVDKTEGRAGGTAALYGWLIAGVLAVVAVVSLVTR